MFSYHFYRPNIFKLYWLSPSNNHKVHCGVVYLSNQVYYFEFNFNQKSFKTPLICIALKSYLNQKYESYYWEETLVNLRVKWCYDVSCVQRHWTIQIRMPRKLYKSLSWILSFFGEFFVTYRGPLQNSEWYFCVKRRSWNISLSGWEE